MRLIFLFLSLPWWAFPVIAGGLAYLAFDHEGDRAATAAAIEAAIASDPPAIVDMAPGERPRTGTVPEVALRAQIDTDRTTELVQRTNGVVTSRHAMYVLVAAGAEVTPQRIDGVIVVPMSRQEALVDYLATHTVDWGAVGPVVELGGLVSGSNAKSSHVRDALSNQGYDLAETRFFLEPYLNGREAGLTAYANRQSEPAFVLYLAAIGIAGIGLVKFAFTRAGKARKAGGARRPAAADIVVPQYMAAAPVAPEILTAEEEARLTPLERIRRREALRRGDVSAPAGAVARAPASAAPAEAAPPAAPTTAVPGRSFGRRGKTRRDPFEKLAEEAARS